MVKGLSSDPTVRQSSSLRMEVTHVRDILDGTGMTTTCVCVCVCVCASNETICLFKENRTLFCSSRVRRLFGLGPGRHQLSRALRHFAQREVGEQGGQSLPSCRTNFWLARQSTFSPSLPIASKTFSKKKTFPRHLPAKSCL